MEFVDGVSITQYAASHELALHERISLFQQVCAGVQHAHRKGIIHRDLKPANIIVTREDRRPVPKILDFGLAKAMHRDVIAKSFLTEEARIMGTPEYMAPEQATGTRDVIDTRADVYSLGVLLYELLTDDLPIPSRDLRQAGWAGVPKLRHASLLCDGKGLMRNRTDRNRRNRRRYRSNAESVE